MHSYYVSFQISLEWKLLPDSKLEDHITIVLPKQFKSDFERLKIDLDQETGEWETTLNKKIVFNDITEMLENPFLFQFNVLKKSSVCADVLQIDGWPLLQDNRTKISISSQPYGCKLLRASVEIDRPIISSHFMRKLSPVFVQLQDLSNIYPKVQFFDEISKMYVPAYFVCSIGDKNYVICPQIHQMNHILDVVIPVTPREQQEIRFEFHNKENKLPRTEFFIGSGILPFEIKTAEKSGPYGFCTFQLLPERKRSANLQIVEEDGTFTKSNIQLHYYVKDPTNGASLSITMPKRGETIEDGGESEPENSKFFRWIFNFSKGSSTVKFLSDILDIINKAHAALPNKMCQYQEAVRTTFDLITGFHLETPEEHLFMLETRALYPFNSTKKLIDLVTDAPDFVTVLADTNSVFEYPRLYMNMETLLPTIKSPLSLQELIAIKELYFHESTYSVFYPIVNKIQNIATAANLSIKNDQYPTKEEFDIFQENSSLLVTAPIKDQMSRSYSETPFMSERFVPNFSSGTKDDLTQEKLKYACPRRVIKVVQKSSTFKRHNLFVSPIKRPMKLSKYHFGKTQPILKALESIQASTPRVQVHPPSFPRNSQKPKRNNAAVALETNKD